MLLSLLACKHPASGPSPEGPVAPDAPETQVVMSLSSYFAGKIHLFSPETGELVGAVKDIEGPQTVTVAPDGRWVACAELENRIVVIDPATLEVIEGLVEDDPATELDETGGMKNPDAATFGPDGRLYVSSFETDQILRYEADGRFVDAFIEAGEGGLDGPDIGLSFAPNGEWLVPGWYSDAIHRYDQQGNYLGDLVTAEDGLDSPRAVRYDEDGSAWISGFDSGSVLEVDLASGEITQTLSVPGAAGLAIDEAAGTLYVSTGADDTIRAFDLATRADLGVRVDLRAIDGATAVELLQIPAR